VKTFAFEAVGRVMVYVGAGAPPSTAEWNAYIEAGKAHVRRHPNMCSLAVPGGAGPSTLQRKQMTEVVPASAKVAVIIGNPVERGVTTALSWFLPSLKAFAPGEEAAAFNYLELSAVERAGVVAALARLQAALAAERTR
jgi:hypothetical protein